MVGGEATAAPVKSIAQLAAKKRKNEATNKVRELSVTIIIPNRKGGKTN